MTTPMLGDRSVFFFNDTATTEIYTLSLHDALPISRAQPDAARGRHHPAPAACTHLQHPRSEEHTSELQSPCNLVCRLLLEKKKRILREAFRKRGSALNRLIELDDRDFQVCITLLFG